jgi:hypothetical protein
MKLAKLLYTYTDKTSILDRQDGNVESPRVLIQEYVLPLMASHSKVASLLKEYQ